MPARALGANLVDALVGQGPVEAARLLHVIADEIESAVVAADPARLRQAVLAAKVIVDGLAAANADDPAADDADATGRGG